MAEENDLMPREGRKIFWEKIGNILNFEVTVTDSFLLGNFYMPRDIAKELSTMMKKGDVVRITIEKKGDQI
jgi:hypothetical protein